MKNENFMDIKDTLITKAKEAMQKAYVPYSNFKVGAALLTESGEITTGCNVENASFGLTICAERNAISTAVGNGDRKIKMIALISETDKPVTPCGACRQVLLEFSDTETEIICCDKDGNSVSYTMDEILPHSFSLDHNKE
jgi:cytidine deaminase